MRYTHGMSKSPEYIAFKDALRHCSNPASPGWDHCGGRGIEFRFSSFASFLAALGPRPTGMVLDRINTEGHFEIGNVRWASRAQKNANLRNAGLRNELGQFTKSSCRRTFLSRALTLFKLS